MLSLKIPKYFHFKDYREHNFTSDSDDYENIRKNFAKFLPSSMVVTFLNVRIPAPFDVRPATEIV